MESFYGTHTQTFLLTIRCAKHYTLHGILDNLNTRCICLLVQSKYCCFCCSLSVSIVLTRVDKLLNQWLEESVVSCLAPCSHIAAPRRNSKYPPSVLTSGLNRTPVYTAVLIKQCLIQKITAGSHWVKLIWY